ncbi:dephospho-CoA kinase [Peribacillus kribbensis]|uniref:dephospho-CoA kinase n=1 Tax=Peribacillus kribbensis TaxID=356658 RepID=UPI0003FE5DF1|nr:dephospho-CoA kinase [Peribacillus kribbensis]
MKRVIGITGGIASGKSTVTRYLRELGFTVVDADAAARIVVKPGEQAYHGILEEFGKDILLEDGTINRPLLGSIIFNDEHKRTKLNSIVHPAVRGWMNEQKERAFAAGEKTVFLDIPLLFESRLTHMVDAVILIYVSSHIQLQRLMKRNGYTEQEARSRILSQMPLEEKKILAQAVIDNESDVEQTYLQVNELLNQWGIER